jgi:hypothetical protein
MVSEHAAVSLDRYQYIRAGSIDKEQVARQFAAKHKTEQGLVCVLQALEPCWTFDTTKNARGFLTVRGEPGKCSHLYHYVLRVETTINNPEKIQVLRPAVNKPRGRKSMRPLRRSVEDMSRRVEVCQQTNDRYLQAVATIKQRGR